MRRAVWLCAVLALLLFAEPALAGEHIIVPKKVRIGEKLEIFVAGCQSGPGFTAVIRVETFDSGGTRIQSREFATDDEDGSRTVKLKIKKGKYSEGRHKVVVSCIHRFDAGGEGTFFAEDARFKVKD
jgi:hypothetical protein